MKNVVRRLLELLLFILMLSFISFVVMKLAPGDAVREMLRADDVAVNQAALQQQRELMGLNAPLIVQYGQWLARLARFDLGQSYMTHRPVAEELFSRLPATALLAFSSLLVMAIVALPLGVAAAVWPGRLADRLSRAVSIVGTSIPSFWLGILLMEGLSVQAGLLPSMGAGTARHLVLPALTLGLTMSAVYVRLIRSSLRDSLEQPFVLGARARGLRLWSVLFRHALRHAASPILAMLGISAGSLLGGTVVVEVLFSYPGMGKLMMDAIQSRDYPVIQGYMVLTALMITLCNMATDGVQLWLNAELRLKEGSRANRF